ncbi:hypothetical protein ES703_16075 [subsurface metagenome]
MFSDDYLGSFNRQLLPRYDPSTIVKILRGVFTTSPYGQERIPQPEAPRIIGARQRITRLGAYQYFREHL